MFAKQIQEATLLAKPYGQVFTAVDGHPAMVVQYVPAGGTGGAAATCEVITATGLTFQVDAANPAGADAIGTAAGSVAFATYTTMGAVADYINSRPAWRCYLVGALRADASASKLLTAGATSCIGDTGYTIYHDASSTDHGSFAISGERFINNGIGGHLTDADDGVINELMAASINVGITGTSPQIAFYYEKQQGTTVQSGPIYTMADDTLEEIGVLDPNTPIITAPIGYRLVGRVSVATTYDDIARFEVLGRSIVLRNNRIVASKNW